MDDILITLAIPTYNNEKTIQNSIESCLNQNTDINYEVLIINNASTDNTARVIDQFNDNKLRVINNDKTVSIVENHNVCLKNALGQYIVFCHSDDTLEDHAVETFVTKLKQRRFPKKYVLWGHSLFRDFADTVKFSGFSLNEMIVGQYAPLLFLHSGLTPSGTCFSRESFVEMGGFLKVTHRFAPTDMITMLYLAMNGFRFEMTDEMIFNRTYASSAVEGRSIDDFLDSIDDAIEHLLMHVSKEDLKKVLAISTSKDYKPFHVYYAVAKDSYFKKQMMNIIIKQLIRHPFMLKDKTIRKLVKRLLSA